MAPTHVTDPVAAARRWARSHGLSGPVGHAPGRVNLIGEHTDYNGGPSLPIAVPYWTFVAAAPLSGEGLRVVSDSHGEYADDLPAAAARRPQGSWMDYVAGVLAAMSPEVALPAGISLRIGSTLPAGAGLSSSASLTIALVHALDLLGGGARLHPAAVSRISRSAENDFVGAPTGDLDQCAILGARPGAAVLCRPGHPPVRRVPWDPARAGLRLVVIATGVRHSLSDGGYATRVRECAAAAAALGTDSLADPALDIDAISDPTLRKRARHVSSETQRVSDFVAALDREDLRATGPILTGSHASLRDDYEVSCAELDLVVETSVAEGALGARMTGGGFGGSAIALVPVERVDAVTGSVRRAFADRGLAAPTFLDGQAVGRAGCFTV